MATYDYRHLDCAEIQAICLACGGQFSTKRRVHESGLLCGGDRNLPHYCPDCVSKRKHVKREEATCLVCGNVFTRRAATKPRKSCSDACESKYRQTLRRNARLAQEQTCVRCGGIFHNERKLGLCDSCRDTKRSRRTYECRCVDCGDSFVAHSAQFNKCPPCRREYLRVQRRARARAAIKSRASKASASPGQWNGAFAEQVFDMFAIASKFSLFRPAMDGTPLIDRVIVSDTCVATVQIKKVQNYSCGSQGVTLATEGRYIDPGIVDYVAAVDIDSLEVWMIPVAEVTGRYRIAMSRVEDFKTGWLEYREWGMG